MKPLYTEIQFKSAKGEEELPCECYHCQQTFRIKKKYISSSIKKGNRAIKFCSRNCYNKSLFTSQQVSCLQCGNSFFKKLNEITRYPNNFCSCSCSVLYNNTHKTTGIRRSKLEIWLEEQLTILYPNLSIDFNKKDAINSELDIYIPSLKLAFELNGIYHYEPIHGQNKLDQIQNNDHRKFQACAEKEISLCVIDTSTFKHFKPIKAEKFLNIITNIINTNL